jgi:CheY-like chemotaxis protein
MHDEAAGLTILIAEDDHVNRLVAERIVRRTLPEATVKTAETGREAFEVARSGEVSLILMDLQMPIMDGLEATSAIRESEAGRSRVPIVALSAGTDDDERDRCLAAGMDDFLQKPISIDAVRSVVTRWVST